MWIFVAYRVSSWTARSTQGDSVSKQINKQKQKQKIPNQPNNQNKQTKSSKNKNKIKKKKGRSSDSVFLFYPSQLVETTMDQPCSWGAMA